MPNDTEREGGALPFPRRPIHHVGFNVPDLRAAIDTWVAVHRVGPFLVNENVTYDDATSDGRPASWDHSAAFGQWGTLPVELQQSHDVQPSDLIGPLTANGRRAINHVGVTVDNPAEESARLDALGLALCLHARLGAVEFFWHDATEELGYCIEIITAAAELDAFFGAIAEGARDWDGRDPFLRL